MANRNKKLVEKMEDPSTSASLSKPSNLHQIETSIPRKLRFLLEPHRYKVAYGGRAAMKSWSFAEALLILGIQKRERILCTRELQVSIKDSVHKLLADQITRLGMNYMYEVQNTTILGPHGTEFIFKGLRSNSDEIKSTEGITRAWVEEAQKVSKTSWEVLIPTIRGEGSEIWVSFNPELDTDETYVRFIKNTPPGAKVVKISWKDNPFFENSALEQERIYLRDKDPDAYENIWMGECRVTLDGAVFAKELRAAAPRITKVPYHPGKPVHTFWDLGWSDHVAIWFAQVVGFEYRILRYVSANQTTIQDFIRMMQGYDYVYGFDYLPHDAQAKTLAAKGKSIEAQMRELGRSVRIVPKLSVADGINQARTIFPNCYFDESLCADGLQSLRHYCYEVDADTKQFSRVPKHDAYSHGADAFRMLAVSLKGDKPKTESKSKGQNVPPSSQGSVSWMRG